MRPVCTHCRREMTCDKNGVVVHIQDHIVCRGDAYLCDGCGARVVVNFGQEYHVNARGLILSPNVEVIDLRL